MVQNAMDWQKHITHNAEICNGRATIRGTRVLVSVVLDNLAVGMGEEEIRRHYPVITSDHIRACLAYAAALARDEVIELPKASAA